MGFVRSELGSVLARSQSAAAAQQQPVPVAVPSTGSMDLGAVDIKEINSVGENPSYVVDYSGEKWVRFNYDAGAVMTMLPVDLAQGLHLEQIGEFIA
eukprot:5786440-Heterocapsa_arctica.AAC.1